VGRGQPFSNVNRRSVLISSIALHYAEGATIVIVLVECAGACDHMSTVSVLAIGRLTILADLEIKSWHRVCFNTFSKRAFIQHTSDVTSKSVSPMSG